MLTDWARLLGVLSRARQLHAGPDPRCRVQKNLRATNGWLLDVFSPTRPLGGAVVLVHGWTLHGKDDLRLQAFARSLAVAGIACVVPHVPGLASLAWDPSDVEGLRDLLAESPSSAGVLGFSFGGSYALLAASGLAHSPRFVVSISGYADLPGLISYWQTWGVRIPKGAEAREAWLYQKLALAWRLRDAVAMAEPVQRELRERLLAYCDEPLKDAAWALYDRELRRTDWEAETVARQDPRTLQALSPVAHPPGLGCPVAILHDKSDEGVPAREAALLADAVRRGSPDVTVEVMVTELLRHVSPGLAFRPGEIMRLLRLLSPLVACRDRG
jgi:dienelactone hydrolase